MTKTSTALVPVGDYCPHGHGPLTVMYVWQPALFCHGGYGATRQITYRVC